MKTEYEILNIDLGNVFSKARKIEKLKSIDYAFEDQEMIERVKTAILDGETEEAVMDRAEADDKVHWTIVLGRRAAADLLTLGKVQPETMLEMSALPEEDFKSVVKTATSTARTLNDLTTEAEKDLNLNTIPDELV